jgi:hypothetical protein
MKFYGPPDMLVRVRKGKPIRHFRFDKNGEYETENPRLIKLLEQRFTAAKPTQEPEQPPEQPKGLKTHKCKKCDFEADNAGDLMVHYRKSHPKKKE